MIALSRPAAPLPFQAVEDGESADTIRRKQRIIDEKKKLQHLVQQDAGKGARPIETDFVRNIWSKQKHVLRRRQHSKCAYCEKHIAKLGDVEHYRPKAAVQEPVDPGQRDDSQAEPPGRTMGPETRPGYWWLAYEWSNYLYACPTCQRDWKRNSFPLKAPRASMEPGCEAQEDPLVLNPMDEDPSAHLRFDEFGQIHGLTEEGKTTIDRCGLDRQTLIDDRSRVAARLTCLCESLEEGLIGADFFADELEKMMEDDAEFAGMCRDLARRWAKRALQSPT